MTQYDPLETGERIANTLAGIPGEYPSRSTDFALEGLLYLYDAGKKRKYLDHVLDMMEQRESVNASGLSTVMLYTCLPFETYLRTGDEKFIADFILEAEKLLASVPRDQDGIACTGRQPGQRQVLVDMLQAYTVFMARAGWLSGRQEFFEECANQYQIARNILLNRDTGLWHRGRNWSGIPGALCPGYWNRAQGLVLRGMVDSLDFLPGDSLYHKMMMEILLEFVAGLLKYQDERGMWHQLIDHPGGYPETSGTALLVHYLYKSYHRGWLPQDPFMKAAEKALYSLLGFVRQDGIILNSSMEITPPDDTRTYLYAPAVPGNPHAAGYMLLACAGPYMARRPTTMI
jgi:rhamnogalacturonyl hydrolase YesR